ncbi:pre-mRNA-splicing factor ISY1 homolog [Rhizophagus clarus]|uniref:Pre-mRNA-splicing factor ISY1 homolog n=1 Tax=Rhizophagus clarus TaxID=94130 RepID=A0A8H3KUK4_9GLOM|nr:pre-mRNA-splicing factor ISY1 homolog [Rhizophagus clarus]
MARNEEKAQSMLYRFREAQAVQLGLVKPKERRPYLASDCNNLKDAEKWRQQIIREISRKVSKIQDAGLSDYQIRDLNDEINKLMREKSHWDDQIKKLGGPDYKRVGPKMLDHEGKEVPGNRGYKYFGRAKDLPGVRDLFEQEAPSPQKRTRFDLYKNVDADYYGYRDEEDGTLLEYEREIENKVIAEALEIPDETLPKDKSQKKKENTSQLENNSMDIDSSSEKYVAHVAVPSQKEVEEFLVRRRKRQMLDRYVSELLHSIDYKIPNFEDYIVSHNNYVMERKEEYYKAFKLFDKEGNDTIPSDALGDLLRALKQNPTNAKVAELVKGAGPKISFDKFLEILLRPDGFAPAATYEEIFEGFQVFDKDRTGYISVGEVKYVLTSLGEKLTEAEVDELIKIVNVDKNGNIKYEDFIKKILSE